MRVLHISSLYLPQQVGGAEKSVAMLAETQTSLGHDVYVASSWREDFPWGERNGVKVRRLKHQNRYWQEDWPQRSRLDRILAKFEEGYNFRFMRRFAEVMDEVRPDILNSHSMVGLTPLVWVAAKRRNISVVHTLRDFDLMCTRSALFRNGKTCGTRCLSCRVLTAPKRLSVPSVDAVVGNSSDTLVRHIDEGYFTHVPQHLRRVIWNAKTRSPVLPKQVGDGAPLVFGYIGRISPEKGIDTLIAACRRLPPDGWRLVVAGRMPEDASFLPDKGEGLPIEFLGWTTPESFFAQIDVLVVPSTWPEPLPRTILEAYEMSVPVIGSRAGGIPDLIGYDNDLWLFAPGDATDLAAKMGRCLEMGRSGLPGTESFGRVLKEIEPEVVARKYLSLYEDVLNGR